MPLGPRRCSGVAAGARSPAVSCRAEMSTRTPPRHSCTASTSYVQPALVPSSVRSGLEPLPQPAASAPAIFVTPATSAMTTARLLRVAVLVGNNTVDHLPFTLGSL